MSNSKNVKVPKQIKSKSKKTIIVDHSKKEIIMTPKQKEFYLKVKAAALKIGWTLISNFYVNTKTKLLFACVKSHEYLFSPNKFTDGYAVGRCNECFRLEKYNNLCEKVKEFGWKKPKDNYISLDTPMPFVCGSEHKMIIIPKNVHINSCIKCKKEKRFNEIKEHAKKKKWTLVSEEYIGEDTKLNFLCAKNHEVRVKPYNFLICKIMNGCSRCTFNSKDLARENFENDIKKQGGHIIGLYVNNNTPVEAICSKNHTCYSTPKNVRRGHNMCRECVGLCPIAAERNFRILIKEKGGKVIGEYRGTHIPIELVCPSGHTCYPAPSDVKVGCNMCIECAGKCPIATERNFREILKGKFEATFIGPYEGANNPTKCLCSNNHLCYPRWCSVKAGQGICLICAGKSAIDTEERFLEELENRQCSTDDQYINNSTLMNCVCEEGHSFITTAWAVLQGYGYCDICFRKNVSIGQNKVRRALESSNLNYIEEFKFERDKRRYDFQIEGYLLEFDGAQHFECSTLFMPTNKDLLKSQQNDRDKMQVGFNNNYKIIRFDYIWSNKSVKDFTKAIKTAMSCLENTNKMLWVSNMKIYSWLITPDLLDCTVSYKKKAILVIK